MNDEQWAWHEGLESAAGYVTLHRVRFKMFEKKNLSGRSNKVYHPDLLCSFEHWMTLLLTNIELKVHPQKQKQPNILVYLHFLWIAVAPVVYYSYSFMDTSSINLSSENEWISLTDVPRKKIKTWECINYCLPIALLQNMLTMAGLRILGSSVSTQQSLAWVSTFSGDIVNWE